MENGHIIISDQKTNVKLKVYKRRWYVLLLFSLFAFTQGGLWNTWGPIADSSEDAFSLKDADIALFANWGPISYIVGAIAAAWMVDNKGLRFSCLLCSFLIVIGTGIRCITSDIKYVKWTINIGQCLNGLAGPIAMGGPPLVSATWFPLHERTTATSLGFCMNLIGIAVSFLLGPHVVSNTSFKETANRNYTDNTTELMNITMHNSDIIEENRKTERGQIMLLMYIECGWAVFLFLLMLLYFPAKPTLPPSKTAGIKRIAFKTGIQAIVRSKPFWLISLIYSISLGVFNVWQGVLDVNLKAHGFSQEEAGWLGFSSIIAGCISSVIISRFADIFNKHLRMFLICIYFGSFIGFLWFTLLVNDILPNSTVSLYAAIILGTICLQAATPLYFEMACEVCYPVSEGLTNVLLTTMCNVGSFIFLLLQMIPSIGTDWENWCLLSVICICIPLMFMFKDSYNRSIIDERPEENTITERKKY
ncbi:solute carrier family 49 member 4-like [Mytilus trossulus]|uniref:solute carrier family 49 member 4-like n=1 Tax=Mytilus trossulus TaxID=6551 RepID=UPI003003AEA9